MAPSRLYWENPTIKRITGLKLEYPIFHVQYTNRWPLTMAFCRMQEHYESPNADFRKTPFSWEEYMDWYAKTFGKGNFTYSSDWYGFNVPSHIVMDFAHLFPAKTHREQMLVAGLFQALDKYDRSWAAKFHQRQFKFYVIGTYRKDPDKGGSTLAHEVHHGVLHCDAQYEQEVLAIVKKHRCPKMMKALKDMGYGPNTMDDELHAYALTGYRGVLGTKSKIMETLKAELRPIEAMYFNKGKYCGNYR